MLKATYFSIALTPSKYGKSNQENYKSIPSNQIIKIGGTVADIEGTN